MIQISMNEILNPLIIIPSDRDPFMKGEKKPKRVIIYLKVRMEDWN